MQCVHTVQMYETYKRVPCFAPLHDMFSHSWSFFTNLIFNLLVQSPILGLQFIFLPLTPSCESFNFFLHKNVPSILYSYHRFLEEELLDLKAQTFLRLSIQMLNCIGYHPDIGYHLSSLISHSLRVRGTISSLFVISTESALWSWAHSGCSISTGSSILFFNHCPGLIKTSDL